MYHTLTYWDEEGVATSHLHSHKTNVDSQIKETTTQNQYDNMLCIFLGEQTHRCDYKEFYDITVKWDKQLTTLKSYITETDRLVSYFNNALKLVGTRTFSYTRALNVSCTQVSLKFLPTRLHA